MTKASKHIIGLGAGGHAKVLIEILQRDPACHIVGLLDANPVMKGQSVLGIPVLGDDSLLPKLAQTDADYFFIGLGSVGNNRPRQRLFEQALSHGLQPLQIVHPDASLSPSAGLGEGAMILAGAIVNADAHIGINVIINSQAVVEHDCKIGNHVHIATGAQLAGGVSVDDLAHIGIGAVVLQGRHIGKNAIVGAGAVVVDDVEPGQVVIGVPARPRQAN